MKKILPLIIVLLISLVIDSRGSDTLYLRFNNYYIKDATPYDTLIFDVEIKSFTSGTYLCGFQTDIYFNTTTFGTNALPVTFTPLELVTPSFIISVGPTNPVNNYFRYASSVLGIPNYNPSNLALVPTSSWGKLIRYKMLVLNNTQNLGVSFNVAVMVNTWKFVKNITNSTSAYAPLIAVNSLTNYPSAPTQSDLFISELGDPSNSSADFLEIYNPGTNPIDFSLGQSYYITVYNGSTYQNVQLTGTLAAGESYVIGGNSYASAYPGKSADQVTSLLDQDGTVSWYLTLGSPYGTGVLIDRYDGSVLPFTGKHAVRRYNVVQPNTSFTGAEWSVTPATNMDMTPGSHRVTVFWDGSSNINWVDTANWTPSYVPDAGHNAQVPASVVPPPSISTGASTNCHDVINGPGGNQ